MADKLIMGYMMMKMQELKRKMREKLERKQEKKTE